MLDMNLPGIAAVLAPFLMVIGIVWVRTKAQIEEKRIAAAERSGMGNFAQNDGRLAQQDAKIEILEDRIAVLERIITDNSINVAAQIEALRDTTSIESLKTSRDKV